MAPAPYLQKGVIVWVKLDFGLGFVGHALLGGPDDELELGPGFSVELFDCDELVPQRVEVERRHRRVAAADDEVADVDERVVAVVVDFVVVAIDGADDDGALAAGALVLGEVDAEDVHQELGLVVVDVLDVDGQVQVGLKRIGKVS